MNPMMEDEIGSLCERAIKQYEDGWKAGYRFDSDHQVMEYYMGDTDFRLGFEQGKQFRVQQVLDNK